MGDELTDPRRAYGSKLKHNNGDLYLEGKGVTRDGVFMQPAIYFAFAGGSVELLGYGRSGQLFGLTPSVFTFC